MISSEHDALISHLNNGTNCCYAPSERYCSVGRQLWIEDKAADFMRLRDDNARRYAMEQLRRNVAPEWVALIRRRLVVLRSASQAANDALQGQAVHQGSVSGVCASQAAR